MWMYLYIHTHTYIGTVIFSLRVISVRVALACPSNDFDCPPFPLPPPPSLFISYTMHSVQKHTSTNAYYCKIQNLANIILSYLLNTNYINNENYCNSAKLLAHLLRLIVNDILLHHRFAHDHQPTCMCKFMLCTMQYLLN